MTRLLTPRGGSISVHSSKFYMMLLIQSKKCVFYPKLKVFVGCLHAIVILSVPKYPLNLYR